MTTVRSIQLLGLVAVLLSTEFADPDRSDANANAESHAHGRSRGQVMLGGQGTGSRVIVDGSQSPELIPDALAYKHFLGAASVDANASPQDVYVKRLLLDRVGLSESDRQAVLATARGLRQQLAGAASIVTESQLVDDAIGQLRGQLTQQGLQRLDDHVKRQVKPRIKVYGSEQ